MAGDASQPAPPPPTTGATATWGTQHFDRAPTGEELAGGAGKPTSTPSQSSSIPPTQTRPQPQPPAPPSQGASVADAVKSIKAADFLNVYQVPCARQGFLTGIGGGAVVGMLRYILGANIPKAANWAVGAFALGGIVSFEVCQAARRSERAKMKRVVEVYDRKQAEMRRREAEKAEAARKAAADEEQRRRQDEARRWYKFW